MKFNDNFTLKWERKDGVTKVLFEDPGQISLQTRGVNCKFPATAGTYVFSDGLLELNGKMTDENAALKNYTFDVKLMKTTSSISIATVGQSNKFLYSASNPNRGIEKVDGSLS